MQNFDMLTVAGRYPCVGRNTIRKLSDKYASMKPGDTVTMHHCEAVDGEDNPTDNEGNRKVKMTEFLTVRAVVRGSFNTIISNCLIENHDVRLHDDESLVIDHLHDVYNITDGEEQFLAIYFA